MTRKLEGKPAGSRPLEHRAPALPGGGEDAEHRMTVVTGAAPRGNARRAVATEAGRPDTPGSARRGGPAGVLVVDDSRVFRTGMVRAVQACEGLALLGEADDGAEALAAIADLEPDVVILDLRMPRLDGFGVIEALHARRDGPGCRILVISATLDDGVGDEVLAAGADGCLSKAVSRAEICDEALRLAAL